MPEYENEKQILRQHADRIVAEAIAAVRPDAAVRRALESLIVTGPTGTNVNDVAVALLWRPPADPKAE